MAPYSFSSFKRYQTTFEMRYDNAYRLWDRSGTMWSRISRRFSSFKPAEAPRPNQVSFHADGRYTVQISLDRTAITDFICEGPTEKTYAVFSEIVEQVIGELELSVLNRVGTRYQYAIEAKDMEDARRKALQFGFVVAPEDTLFTVPPNEVNASSKVEVNDGELGYTVQLYASERSIDLEAPPEYIAMGVDLTKKFKRQVVFDVDFHTKKPIPVESFDAMTWLSGWQRAINKDADRFLSLTEHTHVIKRR